MSEYEANELTERLDRLEQRLEKIVETLSNVGGWLVRYEKESGQILEAARQLAELRAVPNTN